ncbi:MAG: ATP-binding cassette domain-containing protein, partial [Alphaproteobacteria bacterium]|nr:ATP-binding cassette domain-containing protein [Alphaproteobacteria bacterium]
LLSGRLKPMGGRVTTARKLRIGFFAQHQVEELIVEDTPLQHLMHERPQEPQSRLRARLAGFGLGADNVETPVGRLSGGQKARLSLLLATLPAPHLLILDEPTNHLDIESREALVEALTAYSGAVILISHDMHLLSMAADRLWLVKDGAVRPYDDDLDAYRRMHLQGAAKKKREKPQAAPAKKAVATAAPSAPAAPIDPVAMRQKVVQYQDRVKKLTEAKEKLAAKLADPRLYSTEQIGRAEVLQKKFAEVEEAIDQAETRWLAALEKLEGAA